MARPKAAKPPDRRQRRSQASCRRALLELICEQSYDSITVDQIVERADIGRATFYAHYADKGALLRELSDELIGDAATRARNTNPAATPGSYSGSAAAEVLKHAGEHPALYRLVISGGGGPEPRVQLFATLRSAVAEIFTDVATSLKRTPAMSMDMTSTAFTGALLAVTEAWLDGAVAGTPNEVAAIFMHGQVEGLRWALGLKPDALVFKPPQ
jgi:AcrR family transcriptional regulator